MGGAGDDSTGRPAQPVRIDVLGPVRATVDGAEIDLGGAKPRLLLAVLAAAADREVSTERLIDALWPDEPPASARKAVQVYVSNLRRGLAGSEAIKTSPSGYVLQSSAATIDALEFEHDVDDATRRLRTDPAVASRELSDTLARWRGPAYGDLASERALEAEAARLEELRLLALERRIDVDLELGRHAELVGELESLAQEHPYREQFRADHMLALYRSGRQADALRAYTRTRQLLVDELGVEPSPALQQLHQQILEQSDRLSLDAMPTPNADRRGVLVTDIVSSTAQWERDPEAMGRALALHDELLDRAVTEHGGQVFKHTGDGMLAVFPGAAAAAAAGVAAQRRLATATWPTAEPVTARMAVDEGPVEQRGDDFFGPVLNRVMRVMSSGHGGQLLVSAFAVGGVDQPTRSLGDTDLRGIGRVEVHQITADGLDGEFPDLQTDRTPPAISRSAFGQAIRGYELREELGTGASGVVYRAYQASVGREVAIKLIRPERANDPAFVKRFEAEAQFVAQLEHPHIVSLYDYWRDPDGAFLVMPLLKAGSLAQSLERSWLNAPAAMRLVEQVGAALAYAHRHGVLHRDIKPANVLLDDDGNAYLSDFGIASDHLLAAGTGRETTVAYLAPEELAGRPVDPRADLYCLGLLAHEALTGDRPALGEPPSSTHALRPDVPAGIDEVLARATMADPALRFERAEDFVRALRRAFGVDVVTPTTPRPAESIRNPFKGLRAFSEVDAGDFHGRDGLIEQLLETIRLRQVTVAIGPSGIGKSSVVRAGVLPAMRRGRLGRSWLIADMFPGSHPFEELEAALLRVAVDRPDDMLDELEADDRGLLRVAKQILPDDDSQLLLVIDQFEELFSLVNDETVRTRFLDSLVTLAGDERSRVRVLITMRADFFDRPLRYPEFGELVKAGLVAVSMPSDDDIAVAVTKPAAGVGLDLEPGLVTAIVHDVATEPGGLPLLQYAMSELFDRREANAVTLESYRESGGVAGALTRRAEEIYDGLTPSGRAATKELFLRLVNVSDDSEDTRRRVRRSELASMASEVMAIDAAIDAYGSFRLLSFDHDAITRGPTVEVAHEALIREWPRLAGWIDDHRDDLLHGRRLAEAAQDWDAHDRDPSFLLRGNRLAEVRAWASQTTLRRTEVEQWFLDASIEAADDDVRDAAERDRRDRRLRQRSRLLVGSIAGVVVLALLAGLALVNRDRAETERARAEELAVEAQDAATARERAERAQRLSSQANVFLDSDPELAVMLAIEAARATADLGYVTPIAADSLQWALRADRAVFPADETTPVALRPSPSGMSGAFMVPIGELVEFAQADHVRAFTDAECDQFFSGRDCPTPSAPFPTVELDGGEAGYLEFTDTEQPLTGATVALRGAQGAQQAEVQRSIYRELLAGTGIELDFLATPGLFADAVQVTDADLIVSPQPGALSSLAQQGRLVDLSSVVGGETMSERFGDDLASIASLDQADGAVYALPVGIDNKSIVFYNRGVFERNGYEFPVTWQGLTALSGRMVDDGVTPWCWASNLDEGSGWTKTDWIENIVIRTAGPDAYDAWWRGELPFSSPEITRAFETLGELVFPAGFTDGGAPSVPFNSYWASWSELSADDPPCAMQLGAQFVLGVTFLPVEAEAAYGVAPLPAIDPRFEDVFVGAGNFLSMQFDSPEARAVAAATQTHDFYEIYSQRDRTFIAPDPAFGASEAASPLQSEMIEATHRALTDGTFRFDASDLMPSAVGGGAFFRAPERWFVQGPTALPSVLDEIDAAWIFRPGEDAATLPLGSNFQQVPDGTYRFDNFGQPFTIELGGALLIGQNVRHELSLREASDERALGIVRVAGLKTAEQSESSDRTVGSIAADDFDRFASENELVVLADRSTTVGGNPARVVDVRIDPDIERAVPCEPIDTPCLHAVRSPDDFVAASELTTTVIVSNGTKRIWIVDDEDPSGPLWITAFERDGSPDAWLDEVEAMVATFSYV